MEESLKNVEKVFNADFDYLDGLTCTTENYWFNIRGSNTEPKLRVNVEGISEKVITEVLEKISGISIIRFSGNDIIRHPMVTQIVNAYDKREGNHLYEVPAE